MKSNLSLLEFRNDIAAKHDFELKVTDAVFPLWINAKIDKVLVSPHPNPYISLSGKFGDVVIRHIQSIEKETRGSVCTYIFGCLDHLHEDDPARIDFQIDCF